jgi:hypothetical protein
MGEAVALVGERRDRGDQEATPGQYHRVGDLDIDQDLAFQKRAWVAQRIAWVLMALVLLAALLGLLGGGPLSKATSGGEGGPLQVEYLRLARHRAPATLQIRLAPGTAPQSEARVWLDQTYLEGITIETVFPEPQSVEAGPERVTYVFKLEQPGQPATITFSLLHETSGLQQARVGLADREPVTFRQFIYP